MMQMWSFSAARTGAAGRCACPRLRGPAAGCPYAGPGQRRDGKQLTRVGHIDGLREGARFRILLLTGWRYRRIPAGEIGHPDPLNPRQYRSQPPPPLANARRQAARPACSFTYTIVTRVNHFLQAPGRGGQQLHHPARRNTGRVAVVCCVARRYGAAQHPLPPERVPVFIGRASRTTKISSRKQLSGHSWLTMQDALCYDCCWNSRLPPQPSWSNGGAVCCSQGRANQFNFTLVSLEHVCVCVCVCTDHGGSIGTSCMLISCYQCSSVDVTSNAVSSASSSDTTDLPIARAGRVVMQQPRATTSNHVLGRVTSSVWHSE